MSERPKSLDKKTVDRLAREWDKRPRDNSPFEIIGEVFIAYDGTERDSIMVINHEPDTGHAHWPRRRLL